MLLADELDALDQARLEAVRTGISDGVAIRAANEDHLVGAAQCLAEHFFSKERVHQYADIFNVFIRLAVHHRKISKASVKTC